MARLLSLSPSPIISNHLSAVTACLPNVGQSVPWICNLSVFIIHKPVLSTSWITWHSLLRYTAWYTISCIGFTHSVTRMNIKCEECGRKMMREGKKEREFRKQPAINWLRVVLEMKATVLQMQRSLLSHVSAAVIHSLKSIIKIH